MQMSEFLLECSIYSFSALFPCLPSDPLSMDSLQSLSSDSATLAMQQAMLGADDSMDGTEEEDEEEEEEEEEEGMEEEDEEEDGEEENDRGRQMSSIGGGGRRDLSMEHREELE
ncbi:homeobox protein PKNOX2-like [Morone saxatilis]|uniref:homeobox protein PKNOX2-like n=1 Tax=Morone saxatilis TaxID=34816 RepID=UPI0015E21497|nr:homeobox protein PKNOX2-like [Morone saxatilis]